MATLAHALAHLDACHAAFQAHAYARTSKASRQFFADQVAFATAPTFADTPENVADVLRIAGLMTDATTVAHRVAYVAPVEPEAMSEADLARAMLASPESFSPTDLRCARETLGLPVEPSPAPVAAPAPAPEFFRLIGYPETVFQVTGRYMAAERIPCVHGVSVEGTHKTGARVADVEFCADPAAPAPVEPEPAPSGEAADVEPARNMLEAMARAYEVARDGRAVAPFYTGPADAAMDVRAALDAGWRLDAGAAALGDWPWWRSVDSADGLPLDVRAVRRDGGWRLYVESAAEALAEWPYVAEPAPPAAVRRLPDHGDHVHAYRVESMMGRLPPAPGSHRAVMLALDAFEAAPWPRPLVEINPRPAPVLDVLPPAQRYPFAPVLALPAPAPRPMVDVLDCIAHEFGPAAVMRRPALALRAEPRAPLDFLTMAEAFALYVAAVCFGLAFALSAF